MNAPVCEADHRSQRTNAPAATERACAADANGMEADALTIRLMGRIDCAGAFAARGDAWAVIVVAGRYVARDKVDAPMRRRAGECDLRGLSLGDLRAPRRFHAVGMRQKIFFR